MRLELLSQHNSLSLSLTHRLLFPPAMKIQCLLLLMISFHCLSSLTYAFVTIMGARTGTGRRTYLQGWSTVNSGTSPSALMTAALDLIDPPDFTPIEGGSTYVAETNITLIKSSGDESSDVIDGFTLLENNLGKLLLPRDIERWWIPKFGTSVLKSMVVVFNEHNYVPSHLSEKLFFDLREQLRQLVQSYYPDSPEIPIIRMDAKNPTPEIYQNWNRSLECVKSCPLKALGNWWENHILRILRGLSDRADSENKAEKHEYASVTPHLDVEYLDPVYLDMQVPSLNEIEHMIRNKLTHNATSIVREFAAGFVVDAFPTEQASVWRSLSRMIQNELAKFGRLAVSRTNETELK